MPDGVVHVLHLLHLLDGVLTFTSDEVRAAEEPVGTLLVHG